MPHGRYTGNVTTLLPGDILPALRLPLLTGDGAVPVGPNRKRSNLLVLTHPQPCDDCGAYLAALAAIADRLSLDKAEVMTVVGPQWRGAVSVPVPAVVDDGILRSLLSSGDEPVVAVADRFGQLFTRDDAGPGHEFPGHEQVLGTLLNIAISCPECGVPDVPCTVTLPEHGTMSGGMRIGQT